VDHHEPPAAPARRSVRASLAWTYGAHLLVFAVTFASTVVVSRLLTPRDLGAFGVGMAISGILGTISYFGVANYLIREQELSRQTVATAFTVNALLGLGVGAVLWLLGAAGPRVIAEPAIRDVLRLLALVPVIGVLEFVPATLMARDMRLDRSSLLQFGKAAVNAAATIWLALRGWGHLSLAVGAVLGAAFGALGYSLVGRRYLCCALSLNGARAMARFAVQMISAGGVSVLAARVAELIVAQMLGLGALGLYTRASGLAAMIWDGAYGLSTRVIYLQMATELRERGSLKQTFLHATRLLTAIMWPGMAGLAVLAGPVIRLLYGPQWDGAALPLALLMAGQFVAIGFAMNWELCVLTGRTAWQARVEVSRALFALAVFALGALFSLPAAAASRIFEALLGFAVYRRRMGEMAGASATEVRGAYSGGLVLTAVAVGPGLAAMSFLGWPHQPAPIQLGGAIAAGMGLWLVALRLMDHPLLHELALLVRRRPEAVHG